MTFQNLDMISSQLENSDKMPVLFLGHGSPMNAIDANELMKTYFLNDDHQGLIQYRKQGTAFDLAIPTPEHYLPLIYALALKEKNDKIALFNNALVGGSLAMASVIVNAE